MNFLEAQSSLLKVLKLFKFFSFKLDPHNVKLCNDALIRCIVTHSILQLIFLISHHYYVVVIGNYIHDPNPVSEMLTALEALVIMLSSYTILYVTFFERNKQIYVLNQLLIIEREINEMKYSRLQFNEKLKQRTTLTLIISFLYTAFFLSVYAAITPSKHFFAYFLETLNYMIFNFFLICITIFIKNLTLTFKNLFEELNNNIKSHVMRDTFEISSKDIRNIFTTHDKLIQCIQVFNKCFGLYFIAIFVFLFGITTFEIYFGLNSIEAAKSHSFIFVSLIISVLYYVPIGGHFCTIGYTCNDVREEVMEKKKILFKLSYETIFLSFK